MMNNLTKVINSLEDLLLNSGLSVERLVMLKHSYIEKHNYCSREYELIAFYDDYLSHLIELKIIYDHFEVAFG